MYSFDYLVQDGWVQTVLKAVKLRFLKKAFLLCSVLFAGCDYDFRDCSTVDVSNIDALPLLLSQTGLYSDITTDTLSDSVVEFEPQYPLWTDGAKKRRWILLPEGGQVNTQDDENWSYPVGTKFFKEFTRDGVAWRQDST